MALLPPTALSSTRDGLHPRLHHSAEGGRSPSPSAELFHGSTHDYIEVLDEDTAWDREIDPLFDGLISYHQRGWTEFFNDHQVNYTKVGHSMANDLPLESINPVKFKLLARIGKFRVMRRSADGWVDDWRG